MVVTDPEVRGYEDVALLHEGARTVILRARRAADGAPVVLKRLRAALPSVAELARLRREHDLARAAAGPGVIAVYGLHARDGAAWIEMEDLPGTSLDRRYAAERPTVREVVEVARRLVDALDVVHRAGVVHKDVCPANVLVAHDGGALRLIDFGVASATSHQRPVRVDRLEGTPAYLSPEQTGRINRLLDWRSDYYALGATLYELLTGAAPFTGADPMEVVHAHLARAPRPVREAAPHVPEAVAAIVEVLLAKRADDRYQSAAGLRHDLDRCLDALRAGVDPAPFAPRGGDRPETLRIPDTLYGRGAHLAALDAAIARAAAGASEAVFVTGAAGAGKTALVGEVRRAAAARGAAFLAGKFEQFQREVPYAAVVAGLRRHLQSLLALDAARLGPWRARVAAALGDAATVLAEALPELELLAGPLGAARELPAAEAERRFQHALVALLGALPEGDRPAVLFVDDLQWADVSSASLLERLLTDPSLRGVLVLGAWREGEVDDAHLVARSLTRAAGFGARVTRLALAPLGLDEVRALLADTLGRDDGEVASLARLTHLWTGGNPFLTHRVVEGLRDAGLLRFEDGRWAWDLDEVARRGLGDDAAGYVAGRIAELPADARRALEVASCLGASFTEAALAAALARTRREVREAIAPSLARRLLYPLQQDWWPDEAEAVDFAYAFTHDRVQEAARARLDDGDARAVHLRMGAFLQGREGADLFEVVHHLNLAAALLGDDARAGLCRLDAEAGRRALRSGAFGPASQLLDASAALLPAGAWGSGDGWARALVLDAARAAFLAGRHERVDAHVGELLARAESPLDRAAALEVRALDRAGSDIVGAIDVALDAMALLGVSLPRRPGMPEVEAAMGAALGALAAHDHDALVALPELTDASAAAVIRLANAVMAPAYLAVPLLLPVLAAEVVRQTAGRAMTPRATYGYAVLALVLTAGGAFAPAYEVARLCLRLMDRFADQGVDVRSAHVVWGHVMPFTVPLRDAVAAHRPYLARAMAAGDHEYATWVAHLSLSNAFYAGTALDAMADDLERETRAMRRLDQRAPLDCTEPFRRHVRALRGLTDALGAMDEGDYREEAEVASLTASGSRGAVYVLQTQRVLLRYAFRDLAGALAAVDAAEGFADGASATLHVVVFHQTAALACAGLAGAATDAATREALLGRARVYRARLDGVAAHAPHNHRHRTLLVDAELARVTGDALAAMDGFDAAAAAARAGGFVHEEALAHELAARAHLARGRVTAARAHLAEACGLWARWGATAKLRQLAGEFPSLMSGVGGAAREGTVVMGDAELDLATLSKATLAITGEIRTDRLVARVLEVSMENAGATRGLLLVARESTLRVEAARGEPAASIGATPENLDAVAARVTRYVARTGAPLVLADARLDARFADADAPERALSVLALPLAWKGRAAGVLYLENDLTPDAFTPARCRLQELLGAQAAISLENARLYDEAEALARSAARFVPTEFIGQLGRQRLVDVAPGDAVAREMTVLFTDLRGFTGLTERLGPSPTFALLNAWLSRVTEVIARRGGFVHDIVGDATLALFPGAPDDAVRAAVELAAISQRLVDDGVDGAALRVGVGLNAGPVMLGTLGGERRLAISVVGDTVNTAARLETATKGLGAQALVSGSLVERLHSPGSFTLRPLGRAALHGRAEPVAVYELLDVYPADARAAMTAALPRFAEALAALRRGDAGGATARLDDCLAACPADGAAAALRARIARGGGVGGKDDVEIV